MASAGLFPRGEALDDLYVFPIMKYMVPNGVDIGDGIPQAIAEAKEWEPRTRLFSRGRPDLAED